MKRMKKQPVKTSKNKNHNCEDDLFGNQVAGEDDSRSRSTMRHISCRTDDTSFYSPDCYSMRTALMVSKY